MGTHPIFESDFDCLTESFDFGKVRTWLIIQDDKLERSFKKSISIAIPSSTIAPFSIIK